jgi:hypothetical protein
MTRLFYFHGRAGDLPAALLRHETAALKADNENVAKMIAKPLYTISQLVRATGAQTRRIYERDKHGNMVCIGRINTAGRAIRNIIEAGN